MRQHYCLRATAHYRIRSPDCPARRQSLYRLRYQASALHMFLPNTLSISLLPCRIQVTPWQCLCWVGKIDYCVGNNFVSLLCYYVQKMQYLLGSYMVLVALLSQNSVMRRMFLMGRLTYRSFMSSVMILLFSLIWMLFNSSANSREFLVVYVSSKQIKFF